MTITTSKHTFNNKRPLHVVVLAYIFLSGSASDAFSSIHMMPRFAIVGGDDDAISLSSLYNQRSKFQFQLSSSKGRDMFDGSDFPDDENDEKKSSNGGNSEADDLIANARLPISYRSDFDGTRDEEFEVNGKTNYAREQELALDNSKGGELVRPSEKDWESNPYVEVVSSLSPSELIGRFTTTASPKVQEAVKSTILGLIGNLPKIAFETTTVTTGARLASLMFQLQMSGYMFKNAEYRMSLSKSLMSRDELVKGGMILDDNVIVDTVKAKVKGKVKVKYSMADNNQGNVEGNETSSPGFEVEVDADAYMSEIRDEVIRLREELTMVKEAKAETVRQDLLAYIRTLPAQQLQSLTGTISEDVMSAMRGLVNVVMQGIGDGKIQPDTVTEQSSEAMAQLCMWQLVIGYNLRELEVREEMKQNILSYSKEESNKKDELDNGKAPN